jgi:hypothetical protein
MAAIQRFRNALQELQVDDNVTAEIFAGYENINDASKKELRAAFFMRAMQLMDARLDEQPRAEIRDACACSKGGWRLKAVQKMAGETAGKSLEEKLQALWQIKYMGNPVLNADGTITAEIGDEGGFECPCPVFNGLGLKEPVSKTYCYCCAGHFRFHYQIALGRKLATQTVLSSSLESGGEKPCRFVYTIVD